MRLDCTRVASDSTRLYIKVIPVVSCVKKKEESSKGGQWRSKDDAPKKGEEAIPRVTFCSIKAVKVDRDGTVEQAGTFEMIALA